MKNLKYYIIFCGIFILFTPKSYSQVETFLKILTKIEAVEIPGDTIPAKEEINNLWLTSDKARLDLGDSETWIIRIKEDKIFHIKHLDSLYTEIILSDLDKLINERHYYEVNSEDYEIDDEDEDERIGFVNDIMRVEAFVTTTNDKKKIKNWKCTKYLLTLKKLAGTVTSEIWASEYKNINFDLYRKILNGSILFQTGYDSVLKELEKIKGIAILTISTNEMMGTIFKTTEELIELKENKKESNVYEVPEGYNLIEMF